MTVDGKMKVVITVVVVGEAVGGSRGAGSVLHHLHHISILFILLLSLPPG